MDEEQQEQIALEETRRMIAVLSTVCAPIWRFGDGDGGHVIEMLRCAMRERGFAEPARGKGQAAKASIPQAVRYAVLLRDGPTCQECRKALQTAEIRLDHIHPESLGGLATVENLRVVCQPCNSRKGVKTSIDRPLSLPAANAERTEPQRHRGAGDRQR